MCSVSTVDLRGVDPTSISFTAGYLLSLTVLKAAGATIDPRAGTSHDRREPAQRRLEDPAT
jgi:hypothetical protein